MRTLRIGLIGVGVVGSAVAKILHKNNMLISARAGANFHIVRGVVRDIAKAKKALNGIDLELSTDIDSVLNDESIGVVIELMGGVDLAYEVAKKALMNKKAFITANKAMLAYHRYDLEQIANGLPIGFEASVCGGIPIIRTLKDGLGSNHIIAIKGILNGTSNYILSQMFESGKDFHSALKEAQDLGYAEADPTLDINGMDAGHKLLILASLAYGVNVAPKDILIEGIEEISSDDMEFAREFGYVIKLLGIAKVIKNANATHKQSLELRVHPTLIPSNSMIGKVSGVMNGISIVGDCVGESMYYGAGAGGEATASSVIADLIEIARDSHSFMHGFSKSIESGLELSKDIISRYYIRIYTQDKPGVLSQIAQELGAHHISIKAFLQKDSTNGVAKLLFSTHTSTESNINAAIQAISKLPSIVDKIVKIRIEE